MNTKDGLRVVIHKLRQELMDIKDWNRIENAPLRAQEIASIDRCIQVANNALK